MSERVELANFKVCLLAGTLAQGGAERQLFYAVQALHAAGCDVRVLSLTQGELWEERIRALGVPVTWVGQNPSRMARLRAIVREVRRDRPQILQSTHFFTNFYAGMAGRICGVADIGAIRSNGLSEVRAHGRLAGVLCLRLPRLLAANSHVAMRNLQTLGVAPQKMHFLPNVVDTERFAPAPQSETREFHLVAVGRLSREKRFDRFLRVVALLKNEGAVRATLVGDGAGRGELENLARELGIAEAVNFAGNVSDPRPFFQAAHVALLTSEWEGTPNVLLEAQAMGLPVVATSVGGVADVVRDGECGFLVVPKADEAQTVAQLARAAQTLKNPSTRAAMGRAARRFIEENYAAPRLPQFLAALYEKALTNGKNVG